MFVFYVYAFLMWLFFSMNGGHRDIWRVWVKILEFVGILFINWKVTGKQTVPDDPIIHFCFSA